MRATNQLGKAVVPARIGGSIWKRCRHPRHRCLCAAQERLFLETMNLQHRRLDQVLDQDEDVCLDAQPRKSGKSAKLLNTS